MNFQLNKNQNTLPTVSKSGKDIKKVMTINSLPYARRPRSYLDETILHQMLRKRYYRQRSSITRIFPRHTYNRAIFKGTRARFPKEIKNLEVQAGVDSSSIVSLIMKSLISTSTGKQITAGLALNLATTAFSAITSIYHIITAKTTVAKALTISNLVLIVSTLAYNVYLISKHFWKSTVSIDEIQPVVTKAVEQVSSHFMSDNNNVEKFATSVNFGDPEALESLVSTETKEISGIAQSEFIQDKLLTKIIDEYEPNNATFYNQLADDARETNENNMSESDKFAYSVLKKIVSTVFEAHKMLPALRDIERLPSETPLAYLMRNCMSEESIALFETYADNWEEFIRDMINKTNNQTSDPSVLQTYLRNKGDTSKTAEDIRKIVTAITWDRFEFSEMLRIFGILSGNRFVILDENMKYIESIITDRPVNKIRFIRVDTSVTCMSFDVDKNDKQTTAFRRTFDVLDNIKAKIESERLRELYTRVLVLFQRKINTMTAMEPQLVIEDGRVTAEKAVKYGVYVIGFALGVFEMYNIKKQKNSAFTFGDGMVHMTRVKQAIKDNVTDLNTFAADVAYDVFGVYLGAEVEMLSHFQKYHEELSRYCDHNVSYYVNNITEYYKARQLAKEVESKINSIKTTSGQLSAGQQNLIRSLTTSILKLRSILKTASTTFKTQTARQEPIAITIYGSRGAGKTTYISHKLVPDLCKAIGKEPATYSVVFGENNYWPEYVGQSVGVYDEFLARRAKDPMRVAFNALHATTPFNMEGAAIELKEQPCALEAMIYSMNQPYVNIQSELTVEAEKGFYGRMHGVHFVNVKQKKNTRRTEVTHGNFEDVDHYEFRCYVDELSDKHVYSMYDDPTPDKHNHLTEQGYDDTLYGTTLKYRLMTHKQLLDKFAHLIEFNRRKMRETVDATIRQAIVKTIKSNISALSLSEVCKLLDVYAPQTEIETQYNHVLDSLCKNDRWLALDTETKKMEISTWKFDWEHVVKRYNISEQQAGEYDVNDIDHFVVAVIGQPGTGKTVLARTLGRTIANMKKMDYFEFTTINSEVAKQVRYPSVIVLNDAVYDELAYIQFYDELPKSCVIFNTNNVTVEREQLRSAAANTVNVDESETSKGITGYFNRCIARMMLYSTHNGFKFTLPGKQKPQPGYARRFGIPGLFNHGGMTSRRSPICSSHIKTTIGFKFWDVDEEGKHTLTSQKEILDNVLLKYEAYVTKFSQIEVLPVKLEEIDVTTQCDISIKTKSLQSLIELTNNPVRMINMVLSGMGVSKTEYITVSQRLKNSQYSFNPAEFKIPRDAAPSEISSIAKRMYMQLRSGNLDFTIRIETEEFAILGIGSKIYYSSKLEIPAQCIDVEFTERVTFVRVTKELRTPLFTLDKITTAKWIVQGIDYTTLRQYVTKEDAQEIMKILPQLSQYKELEHDIERAKVVKTSIDEIVKENASMLGLWNVITTGFVWKVCLALFGILVLGVVIQEIVARMVRWIFGASRSTSNTCEWNDSKSEPVSVQIDSETKNGTIELYVDTKDGIFDMTNEELADLAAETYAEETGDHTEVTKVTLSIQSEPSKKKRKAEEKQRAKITLVPQAKSSLYDGNREKAKKPVKKQALTIVAQSDQQEAVVEKVYNNFFQIYNLNTGSSVRGIGWKDNLLLVPSHVYKTGSKEILHACRVKTGENFVIKPVVKVAGYDLMVCSIDMREYKDFKLMTNITKNFQREKDSRIPCSVLFRTLQKHQISTANFEQMTTTLQYVDKLGYGTNIYVEKEYTDRMNENFNISAPFVNYIEFSEITGIASSSGDCGTPIFGLRNGTANIIGFHFGRQGIRTAATSLTYELMEEIASQVDVAINRHSVEIQSGNSKLEVSLEVESEESLLVPFEYVDVSGEKQIVNLSQWTYKLITDSMSVIPPERYECFHGDHVGLFGYTSVGKRSWFGKDSYKKTMYSDLLPIPNAKANAVCKPSQVIDQSALIKSESGKPSILFTQLNKYNQNVIGDNEAYDKYLHRAVNMLKPVYVKLYGEYKHRDLTMAEAINGLNVNPRYCLNGQLEAINPESSCGLELQRMYGKQNVGQLLEVVGQLPNTGPLKAFKEDEAGKYVKDLTTATLSTWYMGGRCEGLSQDNLKAELRPLAKVEKGNTRMFVSFSLPVLLAGRILVGTTQAAMKAKRSQAFCQVGLDTTDFSQLLFRLSKRGAYGEHGDFTNWDKNTMKEEMLLCADLFAEVRYPSPRDNEAQVLYEEYLTACRGLIKSNVFSIAIADGYIYHKDKGQGSGHALTTNLNCMVNDMKQVACILYLIDQHNKRVQDPEYYDKLVAKFSPYKGWDIVKNSLEQNKHLLKQAIPSNMESVLNLTDWINYGDDKAAAINTKYLWLVNFLTMKETYEFVFGMAYDSPHKDGSIELVVPLTNLNFVSRDFTYDDELSCVFPTLKLESIDHLFHWIKNESLEQYEANLRASFEELVFYPEEIYTKYEALYRNTIADAIEKKYGRKCTYTPPNYDDARRSFANISRNKPGVVIMPKTISELVDNQKKYTNSEDFHRVCTFEDQTNPDLQIDLDEFFGNLIIESGEISMSYTEALIVKEEIGSALKGACLSLTISGMPAFVHEDGCWSISCEGVGDRPSIQRAIDRARVSYTLTTVNKLTIFIGEKPCERVQFKVQPLVSRAMTAKVHVGQINAQMESGSTAKGSDETTLVDINSNDDIVGLQKGSMVRFAEGTNAYHLSTRDKAYHYQPLATLKVPVATTKNTVMMDFIWTKLMNPYMTAAITGDSAWAGHIDVKVVTTSNAGISGSILYGICHEASNVQPQEDLLNNDQRFYADVETKTEFEFSVAPVVPINGAPKTWIKNTDTAYMPRLVGIVFEDLQSTFENNALFIQLHVYTKFGRSFKSVNSSIPTNNPKPNPDNDTAGFYDIFSEPMNFVIDGSIAVTDTASIELEKTDVHVAGSWNASKSLPKVEKAADVVMYGDTAEPPVMKVYTQGNVAYEYGKNKEVDKKTFFRNIIVKYKDTQKDSENRYAELDIKMDAILNGPMELNLVIDGGVINEKLPFVELDLETNLRQIAVHGAEQEDTTIEYGYHRTWIQTPPKMGSYALVRNLPPMDFKQADVNTTIVMKVYSDGKRRVIWKDFPNTWKVVATAWYGTDEYYEGGVTPPEGLDGNYWIECITSAIISSIYRFDYSMALSAKAMAQIPTSYKELPSNCKQVICVPKRLTVPSANVTSGTSPTLFPTINLAEVIAKRYGLSRDKNYVVTVVDSDFKQVVMELIVAVSLNTCFIRSTDPKYYALCRYSSSELLIRSVSELVPGATLPTTIFSLNFVDRQESSGYKVNTRQVLNINAQGAAASIGGGIASGIGQGVSNAVTWKNIIGENEKDRKLQTQLREMIGDQAMEQLQLTAANQIKLQEMSGSQRMEQLGLTGEQALAQIERRAEEDRKTKGLNTGAMQMQLNRSNDQNNDRPGIGFGSPDTPIVPATSSSTDDRDLTAITPDTTSRSVGTSDSVEIPPPSSIVEAINPVTTTPYSKAMWAKKPLEFNSGGTLFPPAPAVDPQTDTILRARRRNIGLDPHFPKTKPQAPEPPVDTEISKPDQFFRKIPGTHQVKVMVNNSAQTKRKMF